MEEIKPKIFKKEVEIVISVQAQKILKSSIYSLEDFEEWSLKDQKISLGGHNVTLFLENMFNKKNTSLDKEVE